MLLAVGLALAAATNSKRGFVADGNDRNCDDPLLLNAAGWFYDYNVDDPYRKTGMPGDCARASASGQLDKRFAPMNWCLSSVEAKIPDYVNHTFYMGFNEPNNLHNCNTDAATVAKAWGRVMALWPDSQLVSPATAGNGLKWYDEFFGNCTKLYGSKGCRLSYLATHDYSCTPSSTMSYLEELYKRYKLPVWLTEFSCGDGAQGKPTKEHLAFMKEILPMLDAAPFVYRYAWMSARDGKGLRGLVETVNGKAQLTDLGEVYNTMAHDIRDVGRENALIHI